MAYYGGFQLEGERQSAIADLEREIKKQQDIQLAGEVEGKKRGFHRRLLKPFTSFVPGLDYLIHEKYQKGVKKGDLAAIKRGSLSPFSGKRGLRAAEAMGERQEAGDVPYWETWGKEKFAEIKGAFEMGKAIVTKDPIAAVKAIKGQAEYVIGDAFDEPEEYGDPRTERYQGYRLGGRVPMYQDRVPMYQEGGGITPDIISQLIQKKYAGGGRVPSISEYFGMQNKSLGGSNTNTLSEMLGIK